MGIVSISTERLIIIPMTYSIICSILDGDNSELEHFGVKPDIKWPIKDTLDVLNFTKNKMQEGMQDKAQDKVQVKAQDDPSGFGVWMVVKKEDMTVIGDVGFKDDPDENGAVEIGYGIIPEEQRKGYGYEAASSLIGWASRCDNVKVIKADCLIGNTSSVRILEKCGMREIRRDSELIYWEKII